MPETTPTPPLVIGNVYYLKRFTVYHQCVLKSFHEWQQTANVAYYSGGDPVICRQSELLTEEQYREILKQRRQEAYRRDLPLRQELAKAKYAEVVQMVKDNLPREEIAKRLNKSVIGVGQMIAAAKRWGLLVEDPKP